LNAVTLEANHVKVDEDRPILIATKCSPKKLVFPRCMKCQRGLCDEKVVRMSVRPSVKRLHCDETEEISVQIYIPYERSFSLVF